MSPTKPRKPAAGAEHRPGLLRGKRALVTGAGRGIGRAVAVELARRGAAGVAVADRDGAAAAGTAGLVRAAGATAETIVCDLRRRGEVETMVASAAGAFGGMDLLVNNAGVIDSSLVPEPGGRAVDTLPEEVWVAVYEVNLKAVWLATKFAAPHLRRSRRGPAIVNVASVSGLTGFPFAPAYGTTKAGVVHLTKVTAVDLSPVRCTCVCPGVVETSLTRTFFEVGGDPAGMERELTAPQLVERLGRPEEVARLVSYLASDDAAFITGGAFVIDGGALAWRGVRD